MKGPFGRDGFLGEMDKWWLYNKMREEQEQKENDDFDYHDDDFEYYNDIPEYDYSDFDEDANETRIWYKLLRTDPEYRDIMTEEQWDEICSIGTEESKKMDDALLSDPDAIEKWIAEHTDDEATLKERKERNEKLIAYYKAESEAAKKAYNDMKSKEELKEKDAKSDNKQTYPRIVVNWGALKILAVICIVCLIIICVFSTLAEAKRQRYERKLKEEVEARTANTTTITKETTQNVVLTTTSQETTTAKKTTTYKKVTTKKKTTTKKDKYNVYDYKDPEDFYEDNYNDFWDYEDAEDYYREKTR